MILVIPEKDYKEIHNAICYEGQFGIGELDFIEYKQDAQITTKNIKLESYREAQSMGNIELCECIWELEEELNHNTKGEIAMINKLIKKLKEDKDYYYGWQSNIAMAFKDEYDRDKKKYKNREDIIRISNQAAQNFLNMLIK